MLVGRAYWDGLLRWMRESQLAEGAITEADLALLRVTDDPEEVVSIITEDARANGIRE